jgi:hypothetical protein
MLLFFANWIKFKPLGMAQVKAVLEPRGMAKVMTVV